MPDPPNGPSPAAATLFQDVRVFDGHAARVTGPAQVLVQDGTIQVISPAHAPLTRPQQLTVIQGAGRTLIPGLIDAHWHSAFAALPLPVLMTADPGFIHIAAGKAATDTLLRGFTSVRDAGGPVFGLKKAIDTGVIAGPRIFPSGAFISQSGGHGDFRFPHELRGGLPGQRSHVELLGAAAIADGDREVLRAAREQLALGASQLKLMAGGGASSADPLDVTQYTEAELRAAVTAAANWGTYVMVHAYTPHAVRQAIQAGVQCIEHGHLLDEATVEQMAQQGIWWSLQPFLDDEDANPLSGPNRVKQLQLTAGTDRAYELGKKHGVRMAWGTDTLFDGKLAARQGHQLAKMERWFTAAEVLAMATATNGDLLALSGARNPYPGKLGVIEEGALADLLLVDGNPLADISLLARGETSLAVIMKDGVVIKNLIAPT